MATRHSPRRERPCAPRPGPGSAARLAGGLAAALALSACATAPPRIPYTAAQLALADVPGARTARFWASDDATQYAAWADRMDADRAAAALGPPRTVLAISGGGDKGAFSSGILNAWTSRGDRPSFDIVTGVSTGALIAPFAFLGSDEDPALRTIYTSISSDDIYRRRIVTGLLGATSLLDTGPLSGLIERYVTPELVARIAAEHRRGRRLLVLTTNLDAGRGVIWDMGAIATLGTPDAVALFRRVLLASASIPGAFPPVLIETTSASEPIAEMHVDGNTVSGFFVLPDAILSRTLDATGAGANSAARVWVLYNSRIVPEFSIVRPRTFSIVGRALSTALSALDRNALGALRRYTQDRGVTLAVCAIERDSTFDDPALFDTEYMRELYAFGEAAAAESDSCLDG